MQAKRSFILLALSIILLAGAGYSLFRFFAADGGLSDKAFFYDLSEKRLFAAQRDLIPPIQGINDSTEDGVRAVVISTNGNTRDKSSWKIAYLERYSPELKREMEAARATGTSPQMGRSAAQAHRFVKRPEDADWTPMMSDEGQRIVSEFANAGPNGGAPAVCLP